MADTKMQSSVPKFGWIGLGSMGLGMATNLQKHISSLGATNLKYFNRTMERGAPLREIGGVPASSVTDVVNSSDIIFISLSDDKALQAIVDAMVNHSEETNILQGKLVVDTSTVHPTSSSQAKTKFAEHDAKFIAAPVFGASPVAHQGKLLWILAGEEGSIEAIKPYIVGVMGRDIIQLGENVEQAALVKTAGNFITAGFMEVIAEAHVFAEKTGLGNDVLESLVEKQYGPLPYSMSKRLTTGAYMPAVADRPMSDLTLALKDVGHAIECAKDADISLPVGELALSNLNKASSFAQDHGRSLDSSSMYGVLRQQAGLPFETDLVKKRDEEA